MRTSVMTNPSRLLAGALLSGLATCVYAADSSPPSTNAAPESKSANTSDTGCVSSNSGKAEIATSNASGTEKNAFCLKKSLGPLKFSAGPTTDGGFGAALSGQDQYIIDTKHQKIGSTLSLTENPYAGYNVDGI